MWLRTSRFSIGMLFQTTQLQIIKDSAPLYHVSHIHFVASLLQVISAMETFTLHSASQGSFQKKKKSLTSL